MTRNLFVIIFLQFTFVFSQSHPIIASITIHGNDITDESIISREIYLSTGDPLDSVKLEEDRTRLLNLGIFNDVRYIVVPSGLDSVYISFVVMETWRYFPIFVPQYTEELDWSLLLGLAIKNFRGRNQYLNVTLSFGGLDAYSLGYKNPWIFGDHVSFYTDVGRQEYSHLFLPFKITETYSNFIFGRYFGDQKKIKIGVEIIRRDFHNSNQSFVMDYISPSISFVYDTRDLYVSPTRGVYFSWLYDGKHSFGKEAFSFAHLAQSYSVYQTIIDGKKPTVICINGSVVVQPGKIPDPWMEYLGNAFTIRGWSLPNSSHFTSGEYDYRFGNHYWISSLELRQTIIPRKAPIPGIEYGLELGLFCDFGAIAPNINSIADQKPMLGVGFGLRIPMVGYESLRFDYGWSHYGNEWIDDTFSIAFGQKF